MNAYSLGLRADAVVSRGLLIGSFVHDLRGSGWGESARIGGGYQPV